MFANIDQFAVDKALNTIVEEGVAPAYIIEYYRRKQKRIQRVEKNLGDYQQQRLYDLVDTFGVRWEVKYDRLWHVTGNVYVELQALEASQADKYIIFAGHAYVIGKSALLEAIAGRETKGGGDNLKSIGVCLPLEELEDCSEEVIVL